MCVDVKFFSVVLLTAFILTTTIAQIHSQNEYEPSDNVRNRCVFKQKRGNAQEMNCASKNLTRTFVAYPEFINTNNTGTQLHLTYSQNSIVKLRPLAATLSTLAFVCDHCDLIEIAAGTFLDTPNIVRLSLRWNRLTADSLQPEIFRGPYDAHLYEPLRIVALALDENQITRLDRNVFEHMPALSHLSLSNNPLFALNASTVEALNSLRALVSLDLSATGLTQLPSEFLRNTTETLRHLNLANNHIKELMMPPKMQMQSLWLSGNPIIVLRNSSLKGLSGLRELHINNMTKLQTIESGTFEALLKLERLNCSDNVQLKRFSMADLLGAVQQLRVLDLSRCNLIGLTDDSNDGGFIRKNYTLMPNLRVVRFDGNPWHCDCSFYKALKALQILITNPFHSELNTDARCASPFPVSANLLHDLLQLDPADDDNGCPSAFIVNVRKPERPGLRRPHSIIISIFAVVAVVLIGLIVGLIIVTVKRKLQENDFTMQTSVRYRNLRNSTTSVVTAAAE